MVCVVSLFFFLFSLCSTHWFVLLVLPDCCWKRCVLPLTVSRKFWNVNWEKCQKKKNINENNKRIACPPLPPAILNKNVCLWYVKWCNSGKNDTTKRMQRGRREKNTTTKQYHLDIVFKASSLPLSTKPYTNDVATPRTAHTISAFWI